MTSWLLASLLFMRVWGLEYDSLEEKYFPKGCRFHVLPKFIEGYLDRTGETYIGDVFGISTSLKRYTVDLQVQKSTLLTLAAELHRDTVATLKTRVLITDAFGGSEQTVAGGVGGSIYGSGGAGARSYLQVVLQPRVKYKVSFDLDSTEARTSAETCVAIRVDLEIIPFERAWLSWPSSCIPKSVPDAAFGSTTTLSSDPLKLAPRLTPDERPYSISLRDGQFVVRDRVSGPAVPGKVQQVAVWSTVIIAPPRMHRFVRFTSQLSFRLSSGPMSLVIELFDLKRDVSETSLPTCDMGCIGGVPVYNGLVLDHAMPTGFKYKLWLIATVPIAEWQKDVPRNSRCVEFDFSYNIAYEEKTTPYEVGIHAWNCRGASVPSRIEQNTDVNGATGSGVVQGRSIHIRDRFVFSTRNASDMEEEIEIVITEISLIRISTHESLEVDLHILLTDPDGKTVCRHVKHPGSLTPRYTIFCKLDAGHYKLKVFGDYALGGLHPCAEFVMQIAIKPVSLVKPQASCPLSANPVIRTINEGEHDDVQWQDLVAQSVFDDNLRMQVVYSHSLTVSEEHAKKNPYFRLQIMSDYVSVDLRWQIKRDGKYVMVPTMTSNGYSDLIGPLKPGEYTFVIYYIPGEHAPGTTLCPSYTIDARAVFRKQGGDNFLCAHSKPDLPSKLSLQSGESALLDGEYSLKLENKLAITVPYDPGKYILKAEVHSLFSMKAVVSTDVGQFVVAHEGDLISVLPGGTFVLTMTEMQEGSGRSDFACSTFTLTLLLYPMALLPTCPWDNPAAKLHFLTLTQTQARDHLGTVFANIVPSTFAMHSKTQSGMNEPVSMSMNAAMQPMIPLDVTQDAVLRVEISMAPAWLPLAIHLINVQTNTNAPTMPIAVGETIGNRILLSVNELPRGKYEIRFRQHEDVAKNVDATLCAQLTVRVDLGFTSEDERNQLRSELLDIPSLLAIAPLPVMLNQVGWFGEGELVASSLFNFKLNNRAMLFLKEKSLVRVVHEPTRLKKEFLDLRILKQTTGAIFGGVSEEEVAKSVVSHLVAWLDPGTYVLQGNVVDHPYLVTVGISSLSRIKADYGSTLGQSQCKAMPFIEGPKDVEWSLGPTKFSVPGPVSKISHFTVHILKPSVVAVLTSSSFLLDQVRIGIKVPEGTWIGEQRGRSNNLRVELSAGDYEIVLESPDPTPIPDLPPQRCVDFFAFVEAISLTPVLTKKDGNMNGKGEEQAVDEEQSDPCTLIGAIPLPLEMSSVNGGSLALGGPKGTDGRVFLRGHTLITNMHDGRKAITLSKAGKVQFLKIGVVIAGHLRRSMNHQVSFYIKSHEERGGSGIDTVEPIGSWAHEEGWERVYDLRNFQGELTMVFHHDHLASQSACINFDLTLMTLTADDLLNMASCSVTPYPVLPVDIAIPDLPGTLKIPFRIAQQNTCINQDPDGFLRTRLFRLTEVAWISASVEYNFFLSHLELDLVDADKSPDHEDPTILGMAELEFAGSADDPINVRQWIGIQLGPGNYVLRVADDHWKTQPLSNGRLCAPYSFQFMAVPINTPSILSVHPDPTFPLRYGIDITITIRFSEAPAYTKKEDVTSKIFLNGIAAAGGRSWSHLQKDSKYLQHTTKTEMGDRVWVMTWNALVEGSGDQQLPLTFGDLRNSRGEKFDKRWEDAPVYSVKSSRPTLWTGGTSEARSSSGWGGNAAASRGSRASSSRVQKEKSRAPWGSTGWDTAQVRGGSRSGSPASEVSSGVQGVNRESSSGMLGSNGMKQFGRDGDRSSSVSGWASGNSFEGRVKKEASGGSERASSNSGTGWASGDSSGGTGWASGSSGETGRVSGGSSGGTGSASGDSSGGTGWASGDSSGGTSSASGGSSGETGRVSGDSSRGTSSTSGDSLGGSGWLSGRSSGDTGSANRDSSGETGQAKPEYASKNAGWAGENDTQPKGALGVVIPESVSSGSASGGASSGWSSNKNQNNDNTSNTVEQKQSTWDTNREHTGWGNSASSSEGSERLPNTSTKCTFGVYDPASGNCIYQWPWAYICLGIVISGCVLGRKYIRNSVISSTMVLRGSERRHSEYALEERRLIGSPEDEEFDEIL
eukprot:GEMP01000348.1.p1 GENE.GEMP01000348.1~~GEMP01000348.1.p1  ORF type:complete len:2079 (+),score=363.61 GEMP01000348.1:79-6315(+)